MIWPVLVYLSAVVLANLLVATFGPGISILNAFLLIGLDLTLRDRLHDAWRHDRLVLKMGALIAAGGLGLERVGPFMLTVEVLETLND